MEPRDGPEAAARARRQEEAGREEDSRDEENARREEAHAKRRETPLLTGVCGHGLLPDNPARWVYQLKLDGYRAIAFKTRGTLRLPARRVKRRDGTSQEVPEVRRLVSVGEIDRELTILKGKFSLAIEAGKLHHKPHSEMLREC
jgi:hypothetical protein